MNSSLVTLSRFSGKIAIVTASTDGIGYAIAKRLAQEGATVIISSRKQQNVDAAVSKLTSEGLNVVGLVCHVSNSDHRKRLFEEAKKLGGLDILISNGAVNPSRDSILNCDESAWDKIFEVNVKASFLLAKEALPLLRKRSFGRIIFISSVVAFHAHELLLGAYAVSKTALLGLTKTAAEPLAKENITVNCIAPGPIQTKFLDPYFNTESRRRHILSLIPMGRLGLPTDVAGAAAYLASEDGNYVTGETLVVAGGMKSRL